MKWEQVKLRDICEITSSKRIFYSEYVKRGVPFYRSKEIIENSKGQIISEPLYISKEKYKDVKERYGVPQTNDLLLTSVGTIGIPYLVKESDYFYFKDGNLTWFKNYMNSIEPKYLFYWIKSKEGQGVLNNTTIGSSQKALTISALKNIEIPCPPIEIQQRIAGILSAYDDLIENNQKQIKLLEEAAQRLYKEWFVDLHFPGYEDTKIVDGVPEGWADSTIEEIGCRLESGSRPKGGIDQSMKYGIPSIGAENVIGLGQYNYNSEKLVSRVFFKKMKRGIIRDRDILIYKDGAYIGKTSLFQDSFPHKEAAVNEHVFLLHSNDELVQYYLFFTLYQQEYFYKMQNLNKNAAQPGINQKAILGLDVLLPSQEILGKFNDFVKPTMIKIFASAKQNHTLTEARDRLLPKLMSGELEV